MRLTTHLPLDGASLLRSLRVKSLQLKIYLGELPVGSVLGDLEFVNLSGQRLAPISKYLGCKVKQYTSSVPSRLWSLSSWGRRRVRTI